MLRMWQYENTFIFTAPPPCQHLQASQHWLWLRYNALQILGLLFLLFYLFIVVIIIINKDSPRNAHSATGTEMPVTSNEQAYGSL